LNTETNDWDVERNIATFASIKTKLI